MKLLSSFPFYSRSSESNRNKLVRVATTISNGNTSAVVNVVSPQCCESEICCITASNPKHDWRTPSASSNVDTASATSSVHIWGREESNDSSTNGDDSNDDSTTDTKIVEGNSPQHCIDNDTNVDNHVVDSSCNDDVVSYLHHASPVLSVSTAATSSVSSQQQQMSIRKSSSLSSSTSSSPSKHVVFGNVDVREYTVTIGDHPMCELGCPLSLDWGYSARPSQTVETYEECRMPCRRLRCDLRTTWDERHRILSEEGNFSEVEIRRANRKLHRARSSCSSGLKLCDKINAASFFANVNPENENN